MRLAGIAMLQERPAMRWEPCAMAQEAIEIRAETPGLKTAAELRMAFIAGPAGMAVKPDLLQAPTAVRRPVAIMECVQAPKALVRRKTVADSPHNPGNRPRAVRAHPRGREAARRRQTDACPPLQASTCREERNPAAPTSRLRVRGSCAPGRSGCRRRSGGCGSMTIEIVLTPTEWTLVKLLMEREGEGLSRDDILDAVWGRHFVGDLKIVDVNIRRIRQKIEDRAVRSAAISRRFGATATAGNGAKSDEHQPSHPNRLELRRTDRACRRPAWLHVRYARMELLLRQRGRLRLQRAQTEAALHNRNIAYQPMKDKAQLHAAKHGR